MKISLIQKNLKGWNEKSLIFGLLEGNIRNQLDLLLPICNPELLVKEFNEKEFSAKQSEIVEFNFLEGNLKKLIFVGLGPAKSLKLQDIREATASASRKCIDKKKSNIGYVFPWYLFKAKDVAEAVIESSRLSIFKDKRFCSDEEGFQIPEKLDLIGLDDIKNDSFKKINAICSGVELARQLVAAPPNNVTPLELANTAKELSNRFNIEAKILDKKDCEEKQMGAFLAVAKGSDLEPKFIHITYKSQSTPKRKLVFIGKGLTFDSGGYNLKVGASQIEMMKYDMGGSAAVLGAARAIGEIAPKDIEVHFLVATCENMINGSAVHPGDIVKASNGKTIEINNTDAEGRLTLADALVYGCKLDPDLIVDLATLTGACVIALGEEIAGLWSNNDHLAKELLLCAEETGEGLWRMPLRNSYKEGLKSSLADMKNTGPRAGGSITAALFLQDFVKDDIAWAHIDIAGTCWTEKNQGINPSGATGYGVRTLVNLACKNSN